MNIPFFIVLGAAVACWYWTMFRWMDSKPSRNMAGLTGILLVATFVALFMGWAEDDERYDVALEHVGVLCRAAMQSPVLAKRSEYLKEALETDLGPELRRPYVCERAQEELNGLRRRGVCPYIPLSEAPCSCGFVKYSPGLEECTNWRCITPSLGDAVGMALALEATDFNDRHYGAKIKLSPKMSMLGCDWEGDLKEQVGGLEDALYFIRSAETREDLSKAIVKVAKLIGDRRPTLVVQKLGLALWLDPANEDALATLKGLLPENQEQLQHVLEYLKGSQEGAGN